MFPELWVGFPIIFAAFLALLDFASPKKYITLKQHRIILAISLPIAVIALIVLCVHNIQANLYNAGHVANLLIILIQLAISTVSIFLPFNPILKIFQDPYLEIKK